MIRLINNSNGRRGVLVLILVMVAVVFVRSIIGTFAVIEGDSMYPTLKPNDVVQVRTSYRRWERGNVAIIRDDRGEAVIKRIVGLPGESVILYRGFVFINRQKLLEPYLLKNTYTYKRCDENERPVAWHLGDDEYFVLGDNRFKSVDSRNYGPVKRHQINQLVELPGNAASPGFCEIMLSETGKIRPGKCNDSSLERKRLRTTSQHTYAGS
jgi:signal peptidase I